jgi:hypothetical protein
MHGASSPHRAPAGAAEKTTQPRRMFRPSCELKTCTPATRSAWASGHFFGANCGSRFFCSFRGKAYR